MASSTHSRNSQMSNDGQHSAGPLNVTTVIEEGFICAECHKQFPGVDELLKHYDQRCSNIRSGNTTGSIKGLFGKAKQKLQELNPQMQQSQVSNSQSSSQIFSNSSAPLNPTYNDLVSSVNNTPLGTTRSNYETFKKFRASRNERYASEGNKLVIRLFKLLSFEKSSGLDISISSTFTGLASQAKIDERRAHEKSVVEWVDEKQVNRCPDCALPFKSLLPVRRKHHCRLCGSVLCDDCSQFIQLEEANILTARLRESSTNPDVSSKNGRRSSSVLSMNTDVSFRSCLYCFNLLEQQRMKLDQTESSKNEENNGDSLINLYDRLQNNIKEIDLLTPDLLKISESLSKGESLYSVQQGNEVRSKLIKLTESIDLLSKRIASLAVVHSEGQKVNHSLLRLQQRIRQSSIVFIRDTLGSLHVVPTEEQVKAVREEAALREIGFGNGSTIVRRNEPVQVEVLTGWSAGPRSKTLNPFEDDSSSDTQDNTDPLLQQIENVKYYIEQAKAANKLDEVKILQESLEELKRELEFVKL